MKTIKKLQIAAAAASLFAGVGIANAAILNSSGTVIATEVVFPTAIPGNVTNVKAPAFTYSYEGGVTAPASGEQYFQIVAILGTPGRWTLGNPSTGSLVPNMVANLPATAQTIAARLRGVGNLGRRVPVVAATPGPGLFAIQLMGVQVGNRINGITAYPVNSVNTNEVTYFFKLVNNTNDAVTLSALDLTFNTYKDPATAAVPASYVDFSAPDTATAANAEYGSLNNLSTISAPTACAIIDGGTISLQVYSGEGINAVVGPEPQNAGVGGANSTFLGNYLSIRRATQIAIAPAVSRLVQTTNSFQTNLGTTPINGIGGTGGGRFTFKPSTTTVTNTYGGPANGTWVVTGTAPLNANTGVIANQGGAALVGTFPVRTTSGDERAANMGTITFSNYFTQALDRNVDTDAYIFAAAAAPIPGFLSGPFPSGAGRHGDFSTPLGPNIYGGVDVNATGPLPALQLNFTSKPNFAWRAANSTFTLNRGAGICATPAAAAALTGTLVESPIGSGNYIWSFTHAELLAASITNTLLGDWRVCYNVSGTDTIPAATFSNVTAQLFKDDPQEQTLSTLGAGGVGCPSNFASVYGGVKIDVRNFQMQGVNGIDTNWVGILRVINNSETDTAAVEAQYIHNSGAYGKWGVIIPSLAPRAAQYVTDGAILAALSTTVKTGVAGAPVAPVNNGVVADATVRIRVSADVSTLRVQNYVFNKTTGALTEVSSSQGADFVNVESSNRDHIDQDAQTDIVKEVQ